MELWIFLLTTVYLFSALCLALYATGTLFLLVIWWRQRHNTISLPAIADTALPNVLVQLPVYNERAVIGRLIDAVAALDYPRDRLHIQVLDDSTDDTSDLITRRIARYLRAGLSIVHLQRSDRLDYKAGALAFGLEQAHAELVVVFDADFIPEPDYLRIVVPHFSADPKLGMVQTRWGHLNTFENILTQAQSLSLDGHFVVEQTARSQGGLLLNFSGSGGVWRVDCIHDAGGWSFATLAEDLDLSYRAQLKGWRFLYLPDVVVPAEIPPQIAAYKQQQARWAKGSTQNLLLHGSALWKAGHLSLAQKVMGMLHLCQYLVQPLMLLLLLLTPPLMALGVLQQLPLAPLGLVSIGPPLVYLLSQRHVYPDWARRLLAFPVLLGLGTGLVLSNSMAVLAALCRQPNEFRRTPKFHGHSWRRSRYAMRTNWLVLGEALLGMYAAFGGVLALSHLPSLAPFLFVYAYAFGMVVIWSLVEDVLLRIMQFRRSTVRENLTA